MTLPNAWEVERFGGPRRTVEFRRYGGTVPNVGRDLGESIKNLYHRRLLTRATSGVFVENLPNTQYDPKISEIFSAAGEAARRVLEEELAKGNGE